MSHEQRYPQLSRELVTILVLNICDIVNPIVTQSELETIRRTISPTTNKPTEAFVLQFLYPILREIDFMRLEENHDLKGFRVFDAVCGVVTLIILFELFPCDKLTTTAPQKIGINSRVLPLGKPVDTCRTGVAKA